jgi:hypothetical protein
MKRSNKSSKSYSKRPIKIDASSLFNHLKLIQRSLLPSIENQNNDSCHPESRKPQLVMHNYQYLRNGQLQDIYILVAWSKYVVSCQMVVLGRDDTIIGNTQGPVVLPDFTPISVWSSSVSMNKNDPNCESYEFISCEPRIMIHDNDLEERSESEKQNLRVAIVLGTNYSRILSVQLEIHVKQDQNDNLTENSSRHILVKHAKNVIEPLSAMLMSNKAAQRNEDDKLKRFIDTKVISPLRTKSGVHSYGSVLCISNLYSYHGPLTSCVDSDCISSITTTSDGKERSNRKTFKGKDVKDRFVWITWEDGTFIRCPQMVFFSRKKMNTVEELYLSQFSFKGCVDSKLHNTHRFVIIPLPRSFPSLLSRPLFNLADDYDDDDDDDQNSAENVGNDESIATNEQDVEKADKQFNVSKEEIHEAVVLQTDSTFSSLMDESLSPTISFYTTESHAQSEALSPSQITKAFQIKDMKDSAKGSVRSIMKETTTIIGATSSMAKGVLGGVVGVMLGRPKTEVLVEEGKIQDKKDTGTKWYLSALTEPSKYLQFSKAIYDSQRKFTSVSIDPLDGRLMACCDNLGRVLLIDLESKQVIRVWKGFREAECKWFQCPYAVDGVLHRVKYLAIHSKQRNVIEIYRMDHGPLVSKLDLKNSNAAVIQCAVQIRGGEMVCLFFFFYDTCACTKINESRSK